MMPNAKSVGRRLFVGLVLFACIGLQAQVPDPQRVVVLANSSDSESLALARYYAMKRHIPPANIVALPLSDSETITWPEFVSDIWEPLSTLLDKVGWIDTLRLDLRDAVGRRKQLGNGHRISFLVVCRGVPLRIAHDPGIKEKMARQPVGEEWQLQTAAACVDSELAMLAMDSSPVLSTVANPLFLNPRPSFLDRARVVQVSRLDGPSAEAARALVDSALEAEEKGLIGRAYIDSGGPHLEGNQWFITAEKFVDKLGFEWEADHGSEVFKASHRFDAPVLYLGWYANDIRGPMADPAFRFPAGAIAYHLHSSSAPSLKNPDKGWAGPLIARGAAATFGNVYEPYLSFCQRPDALVQALAAGSCLGDAAYFSLPGLSWQNVIVGDPLYRPFARSMEAQWEARRQLSPRQAGYLTLRKMRLMELDGKEQQTLDLGMAEAAEVPSLALSLGLARRLISKGQPKEAIRILSYIRHLSSSSSDEDALLVEAATLLARAGAAESAVLIVDNILINKELEQSFRADLLRLGMLWLRELGKTEELQRWQKRAEGNGTP